MPASASACRSSTETYFVATTTVTSGPTSLLIRSKRPRISSGDTADDPLDAARRAVPAVREEELRVARGADVGPLDVPDAGLAEGEGRRAPEIEAPVANDRSA